VVNFEEKNYLVNLWICKKLSGLFLSKTNRRKAAVAQHDLESKKKFNGLHNRQKQTANNKKLYIEFNGNWTVFVKNKPSHNCRRTARPGEQKTIVI
jgi:hypothetical protein